MAATDVYRKTRLMEGAAGIGAPQEVLEQLPAAGLVERVGTLKDFLR